MIFCNLLSGFNIARFLYKKEESTNPHHCFPAESLGTFVLRRQQLVNQIFDNVNIQLERKDKSASIYLQGMRASGKTTLLKLLATKFQEAKFAVYFFTSAVQLKDIQVNDFSESLPKCPVAILVDEVHSAPNAGPLLMALKSTRLDLVTIAAGVPMYLKTNTTILFNETISTQLLLDADGEEMNELISYWKRTRITNASAVEIICRFICDYCGGHFFPTVKFMEYCFHGSKMKSKYLESLRRFMRRFLSYKYRHSNQFQMVVKRCFGDKWDDGVERAISRVLQRQGKSKDIKLLKRLGWWSSTKKDILSTFLANVALYNVPLTTNE
jgi:energy-coupling factor transporter ATP-binding protein EcfA2